MSLRDSEKQLGAGRVTKGATVAKLCLPGFQVMNVCYLFFNYLFLCPLKGTFKLCYWNVEIDLLECQCFPYSF